MHRHGSTLAELDIPFAEKARMELNLFKKQYQRIYDGLETHQELSDDADHVTIKDRIGADFCQETSALSSMAKRQQKGERACRFGVHEVLTQSQDFTDFSSKANFFNVSESCNFREIWANF